LLGFLPGDEMSIARAMTPDASVIVGSSWNASDEWRAFIWKEGVMQTVPRRPGEVQSIPMDISPNGKIMITHSEGTENTYAYRVENGEPVRLPPLVGDYFTAASRISGDGRVIVGRSDGPSAAVRWVDGVVEALGVPDSHASATNADGSVIFGSGSEPLAFVWKSGVVMALPIPADTTQCHFAGASGDGAVAIGWCITSGASAHALRWTGSTLEYLGAPQQQPLDDSGIYLWATNATATAAVGYATYQTEYVPLIWDSTDGMRWLSVEFQEAGIDLSRWKSIEVADISDDARVIVGTVTDEADGKQAFVARLP
jgi:uncharacterized membrane protein